MIFSPHLIFHRFLFSSYTLRGILVLKGRQRFDVLLSGGVLRTQFEALLSLPWKAVSTNRPKDQETPRGKASKIRYALTLAWILQHLTPIRSDAFPCHESTRSPNWIKKYLRFFAVCRKIVMGVRQWLEEINSSRKGCCCPVAGKALCSKARNRAIGEQEFV